MRAVAAALIFALLAGAQTPPEALEVFADIAQALASDDSSGVLDNFDPDMRGYATLREHVQALLSAHEVGSTVEIIRDQGSDSRRTLELDWVLVLSSKIALEGHRETRRVVVTCVVEKRGRKWKIRSFEPIDVFKP